jgi:Flp pilus assembly protein CpaB
LRRARAPLGRRLRIAAWRARFLLAALGLGFAASIAVEALAPPAPDSVGVLVAAHDLAAGRTLTPADVAVAQVPPGAAVAGSRASPGARAALVGATTAVPVPAGLPLVDGVLVGNRLVGPPGTVVTAVRPADDTVARLLGAGDRVDLLAAPADGGPGQVVAHRALVLASPGAPATGGLIGAGSDDERATLLVAVQSEDAAALAGAVTGTSLVVVVVP